tara:strand:- start:2969 stop:3685 length:717 start_codon:yes stop_codon:yes gene_type:complete
LSEEEAESIIETINDRAQELRSLIITLASIIAIMMPAMEAIGVLDLTPYGEGDDEWVTDDGWEVGSDFECGDGSIIQASLFNDGYKNCRDGSDEPDEPVVIPPSENNTTVVIPPNTNNTTNETTNETIEEDCLPSMYDAFYGYNNTTDEMTIYWDADLSCDDAPHNLTVIWTIYHNETGNWTGVQEQLDYETRYQDWDYVNLTVGNVSTGKYDIFGTFQFNDNYIRAIDWLGVEVNDS